jgi:hypothetical protein
MGRQATQEVIRMQLMRSPGWISLFFAFTGGILVSANSIPPEVDSLVKQLGSPRYQEREEASKRLLSLGSKAFAGLRGGQKSDDPEIAARCKTLLPLAIEQNLEELITQFQKDPNSELASELPAIKPWLRIVGNSKDSTQLYLTMIKTHARNLINVENDAPQAYRIYNEIIARMYQQSMAVRDFEDRNNQWQRADLALVFFIGALHDRKDQAVQAQNLISMFNLFSQKQLRNDLEPMGSEAIRKLFISWLEHENNPSILRRAMTTAITAQMKEALPLASKWMQERNLITSTRAMAIVMIAKSGEKKYLPEIEKLLGEDLLVSNLMIGGNPRKIELRDTALAACVLLTKQELGDYNFDTNNPLGNINFSPSYTSFAFLTAEHRTKGFKKWKTWRAFNP